MNVHLNLKKLRQTSLLIATPMYGDLCHGTYAAALAKLVMLFKDMEIPLYWQFRYGESLVPRARNYLAHQFLYGKRRYSHVFYWDADVWTDPQDILTLLSLDLDVAGALYPKKGINWQRVADAVKAGVPADRLQFVCCDYVTNFLSPNIKLDEPCETRHLGNGHMMIRRNVFETMMRRMPELAYDPSDDEKGFMRMYKRGRAKNVHFHDFFGVGVAPVPLGQGRYYLSEDWTFCNRVRALGFKVWFCPWMKTIHEGSFAYRGDIQMIANSGLML